MGHLYMLPMSLFSIVDYDLGSHHRLDVFPDTTGNETFYSPCVF